MIVYDETEYFRKAGDPLFYYPFSNQKNNLNTYAPQYGVNLLNTYSIYMKRSIVCLEDKYWMQPITLGK